MASTPPSSSATTPSPRTPYLAASPAAAAPAASTSRDSSLTIKEERQRAIQKFFANAELSQLARGLRTRLSYASYKAMHNLTHTTLPDLEAQAQSHSHVASSRSSVNRSFAGHTITQGGGSANAHGPSSSRGLSRKGTMPPPPPVTASATQSLFTSLLQPPPSKRARTIHNPEDPPVPPPTKPKPVTPPRKSSSKATTTTRASHSSSARGSKSKARKDAKGKRKESGKEAGPSNRLITPQSTLGSEGFVENEDDMKAAATLTSLLLSRPSISGSMGSPRSSLSVASDAGSSHSFTHYAQSSARTTAPTTSTPLAHEATFPGSFPRSKTPPSDTRDRHARTQSLPHISSSSYAMSGGNTTPKAHARPASRLGNSSTPHAPADTEAADLMLFLATSPSPARAGGSSKDGKDMAAFRTLGGQSPLKGRVLFPSSGSASEGNSKPLRKDANGSFSSTLSVATELIDDSHEHPLIGAGASSPSSSSYPHTIKRSRSDSTEHLDIPAPPTVIPPTPTDDVPTPLLPPPSSPTLRTPRPRAVSENAVLERATSVPTLSESKAGSYAPPTPGNVPFNFSEFINVSPSPATQGPSGKLGNLGSNVVGRKLFEEHSGPPGTKRDGLSGHGGPGSLGASIDLLKSSI